MMGKESVPALILAKVHLRIRDLTHNAGETGTLIPISPHKSVKKPDRHDLLIPSAIRGHGHGTRALESPLPPPAPSRRRIRIRRPNHLSRSCVHKTMTLPNGEKGREREREGEQAKR